jgi:hypothetical protein
LCFKALVLNNLHQKGLVHENAKRQLYAANCAANVPQTKFFVLQIFKPTQS